MKTASGALATLLSTSKTFVRANLYTFTLVGGLTLRYTDADRDLTIGGNTFSCSGPVITRGSVRVTLGLEVDELDVMIAPHAGDTINSTGWLKAARKGALDGGRLLVEKFISDTWTNTAVGVLHHFVGRMTNIQPGRSKLDLVVKSDIYLLDVNAPRHTFAPGCTNTLYDARCTVNKATFTVSGSVSGGISGASFNTNLTQADGYFDLGALKFTSGLNNGLLFSVRRYINASGKVTLVMPASDTVSAGDTFTIYPGCDKTQATCTNKYSNLAHYRGEPYVPRPETSI